jgi:hypothetical protein
MMLLLEALKKVVVRREVVVLDVMREAKAGVEGVKLEASLFRARPLPSSVHPLAIQHVVWR